MRRDGEALKRADAELARIEPPLKVVGYGHDAQGRPLLALVGRDAEKVRRMVTRRSRPATWPFSAVTPQPEGTEQRTAPRPTPKQRHAA